MEQVQKIGQYILNKLDRDCIVKKLKRKLKYKTSNECKCKESIKKTFVKLFKVLRYKIAKYQNLFKNSDVTEPYDITLLVMDNNYQIIFKNTLQVNIKGVNNFNKLVDPDKFFEEYYVGNTVSKYNFLNILAEKSMKKKDKKWRQIMSNNILYSSRYTPDTYCTITSFSANYYFAESSQIYEFTDIQIPSGYSSFLFSMCGAGGNGYSSFSNGQYSGGGGAGGYGQFYCPDKINITSRETGVVTKYIVSKAEFGVQTSPATTFATITYQVEGTDTIYNTQFTVGNGGNGTIGSTYDSSAGAGGAAMTFITDFNTTDDQSATYFGLFFKGIIQLEGAIAGPYKNSVGAELSLFSTQGSTNGYFGEAEYYTCSGATGYGNNAGYQPSDSTGVPTSATGLTLPDYGKQGLTSLGGGFTTTDPGNDYPSGYGAGGCGGCEITSGGAGTQGCCQMVFVT